MIDALVQAATNGHLDVIKWWIASGREMELGNPGDERTDAIGVAKKYGKTNVVTLLERFKENPVETRSEVRLELGINVVTLLASLVNNPNVDVNWRNDADNRNSALYVACEKNHDAVVSILLAHPDIDVNVIYDSGWTPFSLACEGRTSCLRLLLKDSRVKVNEPDLDGYTSLYFVATDGYLDTVKWWIASGKEMDLGKSGDVDKTDAIGGAKKYGYAKVVTLLERFKENPEETRHAMRLEVGWYDEAAAEMFSLVVFVSDELLQIKDTTPTPAARFFCIVRRLPLELQMIICHRVVGSIKEIIPGKDSEMAFKSLAKSLLWSSFFTN